MGIQRANKHEQKATVKQLRIKAGVTARLLLGPKAGLASYESGIRFTDANTRSNI